MDYRDIDLMSYLRSLGIEELKIDSLEDRIKIQKLVLIGQCAGVKIGNYRFSLYHKGPYSPQLADRYYSAKTAIDHGDTSYKDYKLIGGEQEIVNKFKSILKSPKNSGLEESEWLEIIATLIFTYNDSKNWDFATKITSIVKKDLLAKSKLDLSEIKELIKNTNVF